MTVKFNGSQSSVHALIGGGPQGSLLGQIMFLVQSNDNIENMDESDKFKYIDDLSILELVFLANLLINYDTYSHVPSDIATEQLFLPSNAYNMQHSIDQISSWTLENLMKLNEQKSNYMIFSRSKLNFGTRLSMNNTKLEQKNTTKLLGVHISDDLDWSKNTTEICKKSFSRMAMLTRLKYVGTSVEDLIDIYSLFIRSAAEYCSVAFHSSLTSEQSRNIERIQKTALKIILGDSYISYDSALEMVGLTTLSERRQKRCLDFALKSIKHQRNSRMFPSSTNSIHENRKHEPFIVKFPKTEAYRKSAIPHCQRLLNAHFLSKK